MSERDYNRQAARRQRISRSTLIVGVDIGNAFNAVGFMNRDGNVLGSCSKLYNSREGFEQFVKMIEVLKAKHRLRDVLVGMEPTGHYWRKLAYFAKEHGYEVRFVRTTALKHHRELDESSSAKSERHSCMVRLLSPVRVKVTSLSSPAGERPGSSRTKRASGFSTAMRSAAVVLPRPAVATTATISTPWAFSMHPSHSAFNCW